MITFFKTGNWFATIDSKIVGLLENRNICRQLEIFGRSIEVLKLGQIRLLFYVSEKIAADSDTLNNNNTSKKITHLQFIKNMLSIKSGRGLKLKLKELKDSNISNN